MEYRKPATPPPGKSRRELIIERHYKRIQIKQGIGSCLVVLGIPFIIAGSILLVVSKTNSSSDKSLEIAAPILITFSLLFFIVGIILVKNINKEDVKSFIPLKHRQVWEKLWRRNRGTSLPTSRAIEAQESELMHKRSAVKMMEKVKINRLPRKVILSESSAKDELFEQQTSDDVMMVATNHLECLSLKSDSDEKSASLVSLRQCKIHPVAFQEEGDGSISPQNVSDFRIFHTDVREPQRPDCDSDVGSVPGF